MIQINKYEFCRGKIKTSLSGKYFGTINKNREGFQGMREFCSIWRSSMNKPAFETDKNTGELVYDAFAK
jgi:NOL1/NOP2/fmu family ribosome biogenesis protein